MIVLVVLTIVGSIAFAGLRGDRFEGTYREFTDELMGAIVQARHRAIDDQTIVQVQAVGATQLTVLDQDPTTKEFMHLRTIQSTMFQNGFLGDDVCIRGFFAGVQVPSEADPPPLPDACLGDVQILQFEPDGTFGFVNMQGIGGENGTGTTLVVADTRTAQTMLTLIEIFPGGLIRKRDNVLE
jgi:hypothetical protein